MSASRSGIPGGWVGVAIVGATLIFASGAVGAGRSADGLRAGKDTSLPTWKSVYDWPNGNGYVGWHSATTAGDDYGLEANLGGRSGLWLWPLGGRKTFSTSDYAEWTYTAPGTTRIDSVSLAYAWRTKLLAHHCVELGLRDADGTVVASHTLCKPPPQNSQSLTLDDPSANPTSKFLFFRITVDCGGASSCTKTIPSLDPLVNGAFARLLSVDMTLVDDDHPGVSASGPFVALDGQYIDGRQSYGVDLSAFDPGSGIARLSVDRVGDGSLAATEAACDPRHTTSELDDYVCPASAGLSANVSTTGLPEGVSTFEGTALDVAGNVGHSSTWTIYVDRTPPAPPGDVQLTGFDAGSSTARIDWTPGVDPPLADGNDGSGAQETDFRYSVNGGSFTEWDTSDDSGLDAANVSLGDTIDVELRSVDGVGNVSSSATAAITVVAAGGSLDPFSSPVESPDSSRGLSAADASQAAAIAQASPAVRGLIGDRSTTATGVTPWTADNGSEFGAELTLTWTAPITITNASVPAITFNDDGSYTDGTSSLSATDLTAVDVIVDLGRGRVVSIAPTEDATIPDTAASGAFFSVRKLASAHHWSAHAAGARTRSTATVTAVSKAPNLRYITQKLVPQVGNDAFWNYDFGSSKYAPSTAAGRNNTDNPITLVFWGNADVNTARDLWNRGQAKVNFGSVFGGKLLANTGYARVWDKQDPNEPDPYARSTTPVWDGDKGSYLGHAGPEDSCTINTYKWHYRVYAPHSSDRMWNPAWQFYVVAESHLDFRERCPYGWSGKNFEAAHKVALAAPTHTHEVLHHVLGFIPYCDYVHDPWRVYDPVRNVAGENTQPMFDRDQRGRIGDHIWDWPGKATMIQIDHVSHPVSSTSCNPSGS